VNAREVLAAALDASNRGDLDGAVALTDPQFEGVVPSSMSAEPDAYKGHDGIRRYFESFWEVVENLTITIEEFEDVNGWTLALCKATGKGRLSGLPIDNKIVIAAQVRDGVLTRLDAHPDLDEARRAVS
jgi:ketosteroid isomerase-like protein